VAEEDPKTICILHPGHRSVEMYSLTGETVAEFVHRVSFAHRHPRYMEKMFTLSRTNAPYRIGKPGEKGASEVDEDYILQPGDVLCSAGYINDYHRSDFYVTCQEEDIASCRTCNKRKAEVYGVQS